MKKVVSLILIILVLSLSCKELDKFTMFDIEYETSYTLPPLPQISVPVEIWAPPIPTNSDSIFDAYSTSAGMIEEVTLTELRLIITSTSKADFRFLSSISFYLGGEFMPEKEVAWLYEIPEDANDTLYLNTTPDDLKGFITEDTLMVKIKILTDSATTTESQINILSVFLVDAKILGI